MLAENMKVTSEGLLSSRQARRVILRAITEDMMNRQVQWQENREAERSHRCNDMKELRATLAAGRAALKGEAGSLRQEAISALEDRGKARLEQGASLMNELYGKMQAGRKQLWQWLLQQDKTRDREASLLRSELRKNTENAKNTVQDLRHKSRQFLINTRYIRDLKKKELNSSLNISLGGMRLVLKDIRSAIGQKRSEMRADIARARDEWQKTAREGLTGQPVANELTITAKIPAEEPVVMETVSRAAEELGNKIFAYIADHPDGVRVRELEEQLGVNHFKVMRALRSLREESRVQKEGGLYFAR